MNIQIINTFDNPFGRQNSRKPNSGRYSLQFNKIKMNPENQIKENEIQESNHF